jgi:hypothetical protein
MQQHAAVSSSSAAPSLSHQRIGRRQNNEYKHRIASGIAERTYCLSCSNTKFVLTRFEGDFLRRRRLSSSSRTETKKRFMAPTLSALVLTDVLFTTGTVMVMPFYALMVAKPSSRITRKLMESKMLWLVLGVLYVVAAYLSLNSEDVVRALLNAFKHQNNSLGITNNSATSLVVEPFLSRCLTLFSSFMSTSETACASWLHLISLDVFLARGVFLDAVEWGTPCRHSILLCCMFGPLGVLSHAITRYAHRTIDSMFA